MFNVPPTAKAYGDRAVILFGILGSYLFQYSIKIGKISAKIHEIEKIKAIFGLGMTPIQGLKNGQIKSQISSDRLVMPGIFQLVRLRYISHRHRSR